MRLTNLLSSWLKPTNKVRRPSRRLGGASRLLMEELERRVTPSALPAPNPIDPTTHGQSNLLSVVQKMADKQNLNAQDHFPVPYAVIVSGGSAPAQIVNWHAGAPIKLDADASKTTGNGGNDIQVEVNTELNTDTPDPSDWKLRLNVNRVGTAPFATNVNLAIAFPFDAFNTETLPGAPNILMGLQTRLPGTPGTASYINGLDGGILPASMQMVLTPHVLAGTTHEFEWSIDTAGSTNPLTFLGGEFDGNPGTPAQNGNNGTRAIPSSILNALGWTAYVKDVPAHIGAELKVTENAIGSAAVDSKMDLHWSASALSLTAFDYLEAETAAHAASAATADFETQIVADKMPTDEHFVLRQNEAAGTLTLNHDANAPIHEMTFLKKRSDGLAMTGVASDDNPLQDAVPTHVALTLGLRGYANLDVNANTLDLLVQDTQVGGFNNTNQFFQKADLEYVALRVKNAPDLAANFDGATKTFTAAATNVGEAMPFIEMVLDNDGRISAANAPLNLQLPANYAVTPLWNLWSLVDDDSLGTTAVARALDAVTLSPAAKGVTFDHDAPTITEDVELQTTVQHPMQVYLRSGLASVLQPPFGPAPNPYIEVEGHIEDVPVGHTKVTLDFPLTITIHSDDHIGEVCVAGHIGFLNFALVLADNPTNASFDFRPEGSVIVKALDDINHTPLNEADDVPAFYSGNMAVLYDATGFDPAVVPWPVTESSGGFHSKSETFFGTDTRLKEAHLRLDHVPSFKATWDDEADHTFIDMDTVAASGPFAYVGGVQLKISTKTTLVGTTLTCDYAKTDLPAATPASEHYALLKDVAGEQTLSFGIFGVDSFHFVSDDTIPGKSAYVIDFQLDPNRPYTAGQVTVDTHPVASGALGTFFGGSTVTGTLSMAYVPSHLNIDSNFDPGFCTDGTFPGTGLPPLPFPLPLPSDIDQHFVVDGTNIFVHLHDLAQKVCVNFDVLADPKVVTITSTDLPGTQVVKTGVIEVLFQNTTASGLDGGSLFGAANPVDELRVRLDGVPSLAIGWSTAGANTSFDLDTAAPDDLTTPSIREDILDGMRFNASATAGPPTVPTYPALTGSEDHYFRLIDKAGDHRIEGGVFGLDHFNVTSLGATNQLQATYAGNVNRDLTMQVQSNDGQFFHGYDVDAALLVHSLPQQFALTASTDGTAVSYVASTGITQIRLGGPAIIGQPGDTKGKFDKLADPSDIRFNVDMNGLPARLAFTQNLTGGATGGATITAQTAAAAPSSIGSIIARVEDNGGFASSASLLGAAIKDVRLRLDSIPTMTIGWSTSAGTHVDFSTAAASGPFQFLGGAQVILSTDQLTSPFAAPTGSNDQTVTYSDAGGAGLKRLAGGVFGLDEFHLATTDAPRNITVDYAADADRRLVVDVDAAFGNKFFGSYDADVVLTVDKVPQTWHMDTNEATELHYLGSSGISSFTILGTIDDTNDSSNNGTAIDVMALGLPSTLDFVMVPDTSATLTMNAGIPLISVSLSSTNKIFGSDYQLIQATLHDIPAKWSANWGGGQFVIESKNAADVATPMGLVTATVSTSSDAGVNAGKIQPFKDSGPAGARINYSPFLKEIDTRYYNAAPGGAPATLAALDDLYNNAQVLLDGQDHAVARRNGGSLDFADVRFTGFQKVAYQPNANGGHYEFNAPTPGVHEFLAGVNIDSDFLVAHIDNIPDHAELNIDLAARDIHFFTTDDVMASAGDIDVYFGPAGMAQDGQKALRAVMQDTPDDVHIFWNFGFPSGSANFVASSEFTVLFLYQEGGDRFTAGARLKELQAGYDIDFDPHFSVGTFYLVPTSLDLVLLEATAGIDNDVNFDGGGDPIIGANPDKPGVDGFFSLYSLKDSPDPLVNPAGPAAAPTEYVPKLSILMRDFREFSLDLSAGVHLAGFSGFLDPFVSVSTTVDFNRFIVDFWAGQIDLVADVLVTFGYFNAPDYTDNTPIHLVPIGDLNFDFLHDDAVYTFVGFHDFDIHIDPLG